MHQQNERTMLNKKAIEEQYLGKQVRIIHLVEEDGRYDGKVGTVSFVDDRGQLHGTWGGLAIIVDCDKFEVLN